MRRAQRILSTASCQEQAIGLFAFELSELLLCNISSSEAPRSSPPLFDGGLRLSARLFFPIPFSPTLKVVGLG